jgi:DNA recombination protein RmuC
MAGRGASIRKLSDPGVSIERMDASALLAAALTLVVGILVGWLAARSRAAQARVEAEATARGAISAAEATAHEAREHAVRLEATLEAERAAARERAESVAAGEARLREAFDSLAGKALQRNNEAFAELAVARLSSAKASADGDLAQRQQAIEAMVGPLRESLERVQSQLSTVEKERAGSYSALLTQVSTMRTTSEQLQRETNQLVTALRAPQVRGRWGEMQLERAVEAAGMTEHIDYVTQATAAGPDGKVRPDLVVRLVGGKNVVVDSKVAFAGYLEAMEARDETTRAARLKAHSRHLRTHIDSLADKAYFEHFSPSPEFVVCFVPADAFLDAALREDPSLLEHAFERNIVVATPSTLVALLRTIAYTWRQEALAANADQVHRLGRELYQRLATMGGRLDKLGRSLNSAVTSYNQTVASLESRVLVTARKMTDLKVVEAGDDPLPTPAQVTETPRSIQAAEFADQRVIALTKPRGVPAGQTELPTGPGVEEVRATS